ncbi:MAG: pyruvate kinase [Gammaproteobacteria bacterium]|nr:pyruvate kinase [Gammaproteobacteria bacterium]
MRRTKIIATLGPATDDPVTLGKLIAAGADVVRINFSHGGAGDRERRVRMVREAADAAGKHVAVLGDLQGPKIRIQRFHDGSVQLVEGQTFILDSEMDPEGGSIEGVGVAYAPLSKDVGPGDMLLLDDGFITLTVERVAGTRIHCSVTQGGRLADNKGINKQGGGLSAPALTDKDREDVRRAAELGVDWLAVSFVRRAEDLHETRALLREAGSNAHLVAKIERAEALTNLESIIDASDAVMVARGDLGVEMGYAGLTGLQKKILKMTRHRHKVAITATQMLESMIHSQVPTRAEVSDIANAVLDGTDAVMLSAETAVGEYPVRAVATMAEVCIGAESYYLTLGRPSHRNDDRFQRSDEAIAMAAMYTANHLPVTAIIAFTESGSTPLWMSRIRSDIPIFAFTRHEATRRRVVMYRGVYPVAFDITHTDVEQSYQEVFRLLLAKGHVRVDDLVIVTKGELTGVAGKTNAMQILSVTQES